MWIQYDPDTGNITAATADYINTTVPQLEADDSIDISLYKVDITQIPAVLILSG